MREFEGRPEGAGRRIGIAVARFNEPVTEKLLEGALDALRGAGVAEDDLIVVRVPGAFELPLACEAMAARGGLDAIIAIGCVIRGETTHYDYVCEAAEQGTVAVGLQHRLPVLFGVLTTENGEQAFARAGGDKGNKGAEIALDALRMADLLRRIRPSEQSRRPGGPLPGGPVAGGAA
jgi:6,7-dimethyl-8-ribityllumazine synthase